MEEIKDIHRELLEDLQVFQRRKVEFLGGFWCRSDTDAQFVPAAQKHV